MKKLFLLWAISFIWPVIAFANGNDEEHMQGWGHMMNFWYGGTLMLILFLIVIVVVVYFILQSTKPRSHDSSFRKTPGETSIDILKRRYARGEVTKEEFEQMKKDLQS